MSTVVGVLTSTDVIIGTDTLLMQGETRLSHRYGHNPKKRPDDAYEGNHISALVANGTGRPYALGAMYAAWTSRQPQPSALTVARSGLQAAMEFDRATGGAMRLFRFERGSRQGPEEVGQG